VATSDPQGAKIKYPSPFGGMDLYTPCELTPGGECGALVERISVTWPDGVSSDWKYLKSPGLHFIKPGYSQLGKESLSHQELLEKKMISHNVSSSNILKKPLPEELKKYRPLFPVGLAIADLTGILNPSELKTLTERLRGSLIQTGYFKIVSKNDMNLILEAQKFSRSSFCDEKSCLIEMGKILAVEKMIGGNVGKVGNRFSVSLRMVDVQTGTIDNQMDEGGEFRVEDLLDLIPSMGENLALKYGHSLKRFGLDTE
jgi:hypothetical protein